MAEKHFSEKSNATKFHLANLRRLSLLPLRSNALKSFLAIVILAVLSLSIWVFWGYVVAKYSFGQETPQNEPQSDNPAYFSEGLPIISGQYLLSMSYLPVIPEVRGVIISEPVDYCGEKYLAQFWPDYLVRNASKVCNCESQGQPWRVNDGWWKVKELSVGLMQINVLSHPEYNIEWLKIPENNMKAALEIYKNEGWKAWWNCAKQTGVLP